MQHNIRKLFLSFLIFSFSWAFVAPANAASDPISLLQYIANNMIAGLKTQKATLKNNPSAVYALAYKYVVPYANLDEMSRRVLPPQTWNNATPAQRAEFKKEFTKTLIRTYASGLSSYQDQVVQFFPVRGGYAGNTVEVQSQIVSSSRDPIRVTYRLVRTGNSWRLFDMSVEGVSMLESFRSQFSGILAQGNMQQLLQRLSQHNTR